MYSEDIVNRAKYILGSTSGKNFESMCSALSHDKEGYGNITFGDINEFQEPKVELSHMRFNYSFQELHYFAKKNSSIQDFYIFASSICGVEIDDEFSLQYVGAPEEKTDSYLRAIFTNNDLP